MAATKERKATTTSTTATTIKREDVVDKEGNIIGWVIQRGKKKWQPFVSMGSGKYGQPLAEQSRKTDAVNVVRDWVA